MRLKCNYVFLFRIEFVMIFSPLKREFRAWLFCFILLREGAVFLFGAAQYKRAVDGGRRQEGAEENGFANI
jgi:hypothetical protein